MPSKELVETDQSLGARLRKDVSVRVLVTPGLAVSGRSAMSNYASDHEKAAELGIDTRLYRAATEYMTVIDDSINPSLEDGEFEVVSESGSSYTVRPASKECDCPDKEWNLDDDDLCKHCYRVMLADGMMPVPMEIPRDEIDPRLGEHVGGAYVTASAVATDGGEVLEEIDEGDGRPSECECEPWMDDLRDPLPCWLPYPESRRGG